MITVKNKLTWAAAVESYLETITYPGTKQEAIDIAMDEIRRLAKAMDELNGRELVEEDIKRRKNAERDSRLVQIL
jgi:hypothetical protein